MSREHFLPECLGKFRNYEPLHLRICRECNNRLSVFEEQFCRSGIEAIYRFNLGISGRKHHNKYSPFYRGSAGAKRIEIKTKHPLLDVEIYCETVEVFGKVKPAKQIIVEDQDGRLQRVLISDNIKNADNIKSTLKAMGISEARYVQSLGDLDDDILKEISMLFDTTLRLIEDEHYKADYECFMVANYDITNKYFRAIAEIAFHYALKQMPHFTGFENEFIDIKKFILDGGDHRLWVREIKGSFIKNLKHGKSPHNYCHFLTIDKDENKIISRVQFFAGPKGPPHYYEVFIGKNPEIIIYPQRIGHQFLYFENGDDEGYSGQMDELMVTRLHLPGEIE